MIAVFSDIHANHDALEKSLQEMRERGKIVCLGDLVGYRRHPEKTVELVRDSSAVVLQGNHDAAATGQLPDFLQLLPPWLLRTLEDVQDLPQDLFEWLASRPPGGIWRGIEMVHGTLRDPLMEFLEPGPSAENHLRMQNSKISLVGHTHQPLAISLSSVFFPTRNQPELPIGEDRWALNPGSLGVKRESSWMELGEDYARWHFPR